MKKPKYNVEDTIILRMPILSSNFYCLLPQLDNKQKIFLIFLMSILFLRKLCRFQVNLFGKR